MNKRFYHPHFLLLLVLCVSIIQACNTYAPVADSSFRYLYDYESASLHPEYVIYHESDEKTSIHFRIHTSELLYTRSGSEQPFRCSLQLKWNKDGVAIDSMLIEDSKNSDVERWLTGAFELTVAAGSSFTLSVEAVDNKRQTSQETRLYIDKRDKYNQQNFILLDITNQAVLFKDFQSGDKSVVVRSARNVDDGIHVFHDPQYSKLPPPPFSSNPPELPGTAELSEVSLGVFEDGRAEYTLYLEKGRYILCAGNERKIGKTITVADKFFPEVGSVKELIYPLRYITSKVEYETIETNSDPKKLVDNFWIECAGNKDRARELIRIYYSRVREANYYFSSYTEGWRTDRGMVHLIFGHPNVIRKTDESETWIYGEEGNISSITFVFKRSNYGLAGNVYTLVRDPMFRTHWERMVTTWRNGRVYNE